MQGEHPNFSNYMAFWPLTAGFTNILVILQQFYLLFFPKQPMCCRYETDWMSKMTSIHSYKSWLIMHTCQKKWTLHYTAHKVQHRQAAPTPDTVWHAWTGAFLGWRMSDGKVHIVTPFTSCRSMLHHRAEFLWILQRSQSGAPCLTSQLHSSCPSISTEW